MTWERLFTVLQFLVTLAGGALLFSMRHAFRAGGYTTDIELRLRAVEARMQQAGIKMSEFATDLQGATERYRRIFATLEQVNDLKELVREQRRPMSDDSPFPHNNRRKGPPR